MQIAVLVLMLLLISCRTDNPPNVSMCKLRKSADAHCIDTEGHLSYRTFPKLVDSILMNEADAKAFINWCYQPKNRIESGVLDARVTEMLSSIGE